MTRSPLAGRRVALATMHGKERALAPPLRSLVGLDLVVAPVDTDRFGTFTGERARQGSAMQVATQKAAAAIAATGERYGLASEGSFGPDPDFVFVPSDIEVLVFLDSETGRATSTVFRSFRTNFGHWQSGPGAGLENFLGRVGFPDHGLVVRPNDPAHPEDMEKGVTRRDVLDAAMARLARASKDGLVRLETDMRAHLNPTRMRVIRVAARRLARRLATPCPSCGTYGFGETAVVRGLPCADCSLPTTAIRATVFTCEGCGHRQEVAVRDRAADPSRCPSCNP